ncbi:MAG: DUF362 domain-containing protein [Candidatus Aminicenantes bacterium]|nr:DUF362 domain-containing protein [Candidatus Aminicenantes bacterium]
MKLMSVSSVPECSRRAFLKSLALGGVGVLSSFPVSCRNRSVLSEESTFIARASDYDAPLSDVLFRGLKEIGVGEKEIKGKRILLKPNLVEPHIGSAHINTHPAVVRALNEVLLRLGASSVVVGEGAGHQRDFYRMLEESGYADMLVDEHIPFVDLNNAGVGAVQNQGRRTRLGAFLIPQIVLDADMIVSVAKMKTHHWAGVTLSMKNMFGIMPGAFYGWPKNVLHYAGIHESICDIYATIRPHLAVVDGIVGMEGDGPIMGTVKKAGVLVVGRNFPAVDATCARIMGVDPEKIPYLKESSGWLGAVREILIPQRGEAIVSVRTDFELLDKIPAHRELRLLPSQPMKKFF